MATGRPFRYEGSYASSYDNTASSFQQIALSTGFLRSESMDLNNDPRFFAANVIDKRLAAFGSLSIVSGLMLGTSMDQCFSLNKDFDLTPKWPYMGYFQLIGFCMQMCVTFMCLIALYVTAHQLFYTYRLMTSGPTGFECASVFYLSKSIVMWRHFSIKCLFHGLWLFMLSSGFQLLGKFYKDALATQNPPKAKLDMEVHTNIAIAVMLCFVAVSILLGIVRQQHLWAFQEQYKAVKAVSRPIAETARFMGMRGTDHLET
eukprot:TRINITY_DN80208_c0_g1_i1.p1 TRINITY_DN80208_c0_g1~~TRINITY_DN80208_c0_g1_i1.p1  ORF type:complete len:260 (+),score=51.06 TRINITY_DN80208_c0_g1_i1:115-894(+)